MLPAAFHRTEVHANNPLETDHGRLKARLRPMRGLKRDRTARVIVAGHALVQNLRRGFYDLGTGVPSAARLADAFTELALVTRYLPARTGPPRPDFSQRNSAAIDASEVEIDRLHVTKRACAISLLDKPAPAAAVILRRLRPTSASVRDAAAVAMAACLSGPTR
jgi:hypothetical protein